VRTRILDLIDVLYQLVPGAPAPRHATSRSGDIYESVGSPVKARDVLGFAAQATLAQGLKETVACMQ
jgi:nucleoside-diphosphate-sugar epimerase